MNEPSRDADEINLALIFLPLWARKKWLIFAMVILSGFSIWYAYTRQKTFDSTVRLIPVDPGSKSDALGGAAALLGKKTGSSGDPELYKSLLTSRRVVKLVLDETIVDNSDTGKGRRLALSTLLMVDKNNPIGYDNSIEGLRSSVSVLTKDAGIVEVTIRSSQPWLAKQIAEKVVAVGQETITKIQAERFNASIAKMTLASNQAKQEWDSSARMISNYRDFNRAISLPSQQLQLDRMVLEKSAKEQKYLLVKRELEQAQVEKMKALPPMMVLDEAEMPIRKSGPKRLKIMISILGVGFLGACILILLIEYFPRADRSRKQ